MKEYFLKELTGLVELTKAGVGKAVEVLQAEAPELIKQIMAWNFTVSIIGFLFGIAIFIAAIKWRKISWKKYQEDTRYNDGWYFGCMAGTIAGVAVGMIFICESLIWLKILVAPKLFLIEYLTKLIK